ncbi:MAG: lipase [Beijerinckiaceae bacterium]|nr:lipase [Beijerinckiaceae bacterium]
MNKQAFLVAALCLGAAGPMAQAAEVAVPPFYQAVAALSTDGKLGEVVAKEQVTTSIPGAEAWRIAYVSSDVREKKTLSTALVIAPRGAPPAAGRPIVAWAHGTTGGAQNCGPSQVTDPAQDLNEYYLIGGTSWTDFGVPAATQFIKDGYVLVATDYQGLGGGGVHQYALAATQGRDIVNSVRAVGAMGLSGSAKNAVAYGWSQGGGAVLGAASLKDYIGKPGTAFDGVSFVGFVALAPHEVEVLIPPGATEEAAAQKTMAGLAQAFSSNVFNFTHYAMTMWGTAAAFPELKLTDIFTDEGVGVVNEVFGKKCMHAAADTLSFNYADTYKALVKPQAANAPAWVKGLIEGSVLPELPIAPVVIYFGSKDTTNPPVMGQLYQERRCAAGANIARVQLPGEQNHFTTPPTSQPLYMPWIADRFAGKPMANGCPAK